MNALIDQSQRWEFDRRLPLAQQVYEDLRRRILSLELPLDRPLSRIELSQHYQISQTPLREALQKLGEEGLVATYPQS
ncbi:MAG: GntR family transcriptional regulator, partial [Pseudolabrys sp.]|nr:GntR family transcriptional regulator [Pseudolabrys sp.]